MIAGVLIGLVLLVLLVVAHELGHAIVAKRNGVTIEEFGIGFPPTAWAKKLKNGVLFKLNWLPLGGYVKLQGEYDSASGKGDYGSATYWQKTKILFAGVFVNWLVAAVLLSIVALLGMPKVLPDQFSIPSDATVSNGSVIISSLTKDHPAEKAGFMVGDKIIKFNGETVESADELVAAIKENHDQEVTISYVRNDAFYDKKVLLNGDDNGGVFGAGLGQNQSVRSTWSAPIVGVGTTIQFTVVAIQGVANMLYNFATGLIMQFSPDAATSTAAKQNLDSVSQTVAGPIGILGVIFPAASKAGVVELTFLTAIISLTLAVMNALPIPALDGGRWSVMTLYKLRKKELTKEREENIQTVGFLLLMALTVLVTFADVSKIL